MAPMRRSGGFVFSEFLVVLGVFGFLIAIVVVSLRGLDDDAATRECQTELRAIKAASEQFYAELRFYPPNDQALEDANLMRRQESPNYRVVTTNNAAQPSYEPEGTRCS